MLSTLTSLGNRSRILSTKFLTRLGLREETFLIAPAVLIGVVTAAAAVGFHEAIRRIRDFLYVGVGGDVLYGKGIVLLILFPALGGLSVGIIARYLAKTREGHGIIDVIESVVKTSGFVKPITALEKIITSALTIGTGGSAGAEGPIVQIGAAIASGFGSLFRIARHQMPVIIGCGSAAGISAIFNAPIGGVLFTIEVILQDFSIRTFTPLVVASVIANVTTRTIFASLNGGSDEYVAIFALPSGALGGVGQIIDLAQVIPYGLLGFVCGLTGVSLTIAMPRIETSFHRLRRIGALLPALGGAIVGVIGIAFVLILGRLLLHQPKPFAFGSYPMPAFFGDGYGVINVLLGSAFYTNQHVTTLLLLLAALCLAKVIATCVTLGSGGSGGIIAPSLFLGATAGGLLGLLLRQSGWFPQIRPEIYALVGMGAVLAAVVHAPMASIVILLELTTDYRITLPAMLTTVIAVGTARLIFADSIYSASLRQRGIRVGSASDLSILRRLNVEQVELEPAAVVQMSDGVQRLFDLSSQLGTVNFVVIDQEGNYRGIVGTGDINIALMQREAVPLMIVSELMRSDVPVVTTQDSLAQVFEIFSTIRVSHLPVSLPSDRKRVIGLVSQVGLMRKYQHMLSE